MNGLVNRDNWIFIYMQNMAYFEQFTAKTEYPFGFQADFLTSILFLAISFLSFI